MHETRSGYIDALKGVAMIGVIVVHSGINQFSGGVGIVGSLGRNGCQLFFLFTGYLSFISIQNFFKLHEKSLKETVKWIMRKIVRLMPLYFLSLAIWIHLGGQSYYLASDEKITGWNMLMHIFMLHDLVPHYANSITGVEWYLGVIVLFYMLLPLIYKYFEGIYRRLILFIGSIIFSYFYIKIGCLHLPIQDAYVYRDFLCVYSFPAQFPVLVLGTLLTDINFISKTNRIKEKKILSYEILIVSIAMLVAHSYGKNSLFLFSADQFCSVLLFLIIIAMQLYPNPWIDNFLFRWFGMHSYPIYLFHFLIIYLIQKINLFRNSSSMAIITKIFFVIIISSCIGVILEKAIDEPLNKRIDELFTQYS